MIGFGWIGLEVIELKFMSLSSNGWVLTGLDLIGLDMVWLGEIGLVLI